MNDLTDHEQANVRTALLLMRFRVGAWEPLAKQLHVHRKTLGKIAGGRQPVTASLALRLARLVEATFDDLVNGRYLPCGTCPRCGYPANQYEAPEHTSVEDKPRELVLKAVR